MASAVDKQPADARLVAGRSGGLLTHSYKREPELLHHVRGHNRDERMSCR